MTIRPLLGLLAASLAWSQTAPTFAERLGFDKTDRVLILHMDDAGMSYDSNIGIEQVLEHGAARSLSVMMPCPWVPQIVHYLRAHAGTDAGLHLTLNSEWREYRWGPLAGVSIVPGLVDDEGAMWSSVNAVAARATPDEVDHEIRAQLDRAERMGFHPTHLDSHMGTVFARPDFLERYVRLGIDMQIPVMLPGGHDTNIRSETPGGSDALLAQMRRIGEQLWRAGLPVLDDLVNSSYGWKLPNGLDPRDDEGLQQWRTDRYIEVLSRLKPGVTMVIMHCTSPTEVFQHISDSGYIRRADMLAMLDPRFQRYLQEEGFIVTTWRDLTERRRAIRSEGFGK